jgi:NAD(P)-dependent dehydrogenase (short-subunit alcohol dehydrogenase family)
MTQQQGNRFKDQVVWISGAASGIGRGIAEFYANEGAEVSLVDNNKILGESLAKDISVAGGTCKFFHCDVSDEFALKASIEKTFEIFGNLNILVNNAAKILIKPLHQISLEEWDDQMAVNLRAYFLSFKYAYPYLKQNELSYVVNIGSVNSFVGQANTPGYNASKAAILNLSKSIAIDYAKDGIRCNTVCPGITDTPMLREHMGSEEALTKRLTRAPINRVLSTYEVAKAVAYLSSEDSSGITGTNLVIDGGYLATAEWGGNHHE